MIFPITELLDEQESMMWIERPCHPKGLQCPRCGAAKHEAREFREHKSGIVDDRVTTATVPITFIRGPCWQAVPWLPGEWFC
jgi:hypothetical protein